MYTSHVTDEMISSWLTREHPRPEEAQAQWRQQGLALLPMGKRVAAVRLAAEVVHAAVGRDTREGVAATLAELLNGPVICDPRNGHYYPLVPGWARTLWTHSRGVFLGEGVYLGVPALTWRTPVGLGAYWVVPPLEVGQLCELSSVTALATMGATAVARSED